MNESEELESLLEKAPARTQAKIRDLVDEKTAAHAALSAASEARNAAIKHAAEVRAHFRDRFADVDINDGPDGPTFDFPTGRRASDPEEAKPWTERVIKSANQVQRHNAAHNKARAAWDGYAFLSDLRDWLAYGAKSSQLKATIAPAAKLNKGQSHAEAVDFIRSQLDELASRSKSLEVAPAPVSDLVARMESEVDALATSRAPAIYMGNRDASPVDVGLTSDPRRDSFIFWALSDVLKTEAAKKIREAHPGNGVSDFERAAELSALEADKLSLERLEESHIVAAAEIGQHIPRRREADPRAILEVEA